MQYIIVLTAVIAVIFLINRYNKNKPQDEKPNYMNNIIGVIVVGFILVFLMRSCGPQADRNNDQEDNTTAQ